MSQDSFFTLGYYCIFYQNAFLNVAFRVNNSFQVVPPHSLERADERVCVAGSPLNPRRVSEIRADSGVLGRSKFCLK